MENNACRLGWCKREVQENVSREDPVGSRSGHDIEKWSKFSKSDVCERQVEFWRPCRGLSPGKGFAPNSSTWLVETEISSVLEEQYFIAHTPVQILAKMLGENLENIFTKMKISHDPVVRFC